MRKILYIFSFVMVAALLSACGGNKISPEEKLIIDLISRWAAPQSEEIIADFYDGWDVIGDNSDNTSASEDTDNAAIVNSLSFRCYFKDGKICKLDFPNGMITPQFFVQ